MKTWKCICPLFRASYKRLFRKLKVKKIRKWLFLILTQKSSSYKMIWFPRIHSSVENGYFLLVSFRYCTVFLLMELVFLLVIPDIVEEIDSAIWKTGNQYYLIIGNSLLICSISSHGSIPFTLQNIELFYVKYNSWIRALGSLESMAFPLSLLLLSVQY